MKAKTALTVLLACLVLCGCVHAGAPFEASTAPETPTTIPAQLDVEAPLTCPAESREEAEQIAQQYGITLVDFDFGVATYTTEQDPREVIQKGVENGWPELSLNHVIEID